jgi:hypothetical protein
MKMMDFCDREMKIADLEKRLNEKKSNVWIELGRMAYSLKDFIDLLEEGSTEKMRLERAKTAIDKVACKIASRGRI